MAATMAEPRKPRVIRTRPGTIPPVAAAPGGGETPVRSTSDKVSVVPVPHEPVPAEETFEGARTQAHAKPAARRNWKLLSLRPFRRRPGVAVAVKEPHTDPDRESAAGNGTAGDGGNSSGDLPETGAKVLSFPISPYRRRRRTIVLGAGSVAAVLALVMGVALFSPVLAVQKVVFDGQQLIAEDILQKAVAPILSTPLPQVSEAAVQELLASVIQVKSSRIEARPPSTLLVHIVERVPVALLKNGEEYLLVDQDGVQLASTKDPEAAALPLIEGGKAAIGNDTFRAITAVLANLPKSVLVQMANASARSPDAVELKLADGRKVIWGNASDVELKSEVLAALLNAPPPTPEPGKPATVPAQVFDVSAPRHPVTR